MDTISIEKFYAQSLGVKAPWKVSKVTIHGDLREARVLVECPHGIAWADPETKERAEVKEWKERSWRHLDTCEYKTIVTAKVPRIKLKSGQTITVNVPWAEPGGRFTCRMEARLIDYLLESRVVKGGRQTWPGNSGPDGWSHAAGSRAGHGLP